METWLSSYREGNEVWQDTVPFFLITRVEGWGQNLPLALSALKTCLPSPLPQWAKSASFHSKLMVVVIDVFCPVYAVYSIWCSLKKKSMDVMSLWLSSCFRSKHDVLAVDAHGDWQLYPCFPIISGSCGFDVESVVTETNKQTNKANSKIGKMKPSVTACSTQLATEPRVEERVLPVHVNAAFPRVAPAQGRGCQVAAKSELSSEHKEASVACRKASQLTVWQRSHESPEGWEFRS